ncbi:tenascin-like isoform X2 [Antennarius striatus]|uniref:tenascin-like isoform X2 n=1 Tax=Antennarius striatus TaxID=241820 RepID=UPI0035AF9965
MLLFIPSLLVSLLLAAPATLTPPTSQEVQVRGQRAPREDQDSIKVVISEGCATQGDASDASHGGKEINLIPGSPLVLTHKINLVPSGSGSGSGSCGCETDFAALKDRLERIEREVSALREKCGGADGGCCTSKESKGAGCSITPEVHDCPNECSDQGRCLEGKCVCFTGFSGPDCSRSDCPGNCNDNGKCVTGRCVCDPGFTGPDCSQRDCPSKCNNRGKCVKGRCLCDGGFAGPTCSDKTCPGNCNSRGRCVDGECVCSPGFAAPDCSMKACPDGCNNRGKCVNGKCVCDSGFTGEDCSEVACPGNCNSRGRCLNGACVCEDGFSGPDCSRRTCPNDCNNRGKCLNGKCVCDSSFTGEDCSETSCPENCNSRGRCVDGRCVCRNGFTGADCSEKACPKNCSNRGRCMNGRCACDVGASGPDCSYKACPKNCNMKGRCIKGRCVCRRGFTGPDCSQCEKGMTGPNCDTVMSGVSQLSVRDVTETGATVVWTPPPVQYDTYHITFTSQKEGDQQITAQLDGGLTGFTQTGLASGQEYRVSIAGEVDGQKGAESSTEFMTLLSGPTNLQVAKMTTTSAVVQWVESQGEIDRYRLTVTPNDGTGRSQEMTVPAGQSSAHIQQLEPGRLYDITLVAEKGSSRSEPTTTQVTPGPEPPTNIVFSQVTDNAVTVSWTKPKSPVSSFKVTYTHTDEGEPVSVSAKSSDSSLALSHLTPGSTYEISVISVLGLDESDPITDFVKTLPDRPTDLRVLNVTDSAALLLWRPALAAVDEYAIVYGSGSGSEVRVTVSGNSAEQQLSDLEESTTYTVTVSSQLGGQESPPTSTSFTTAGGSGGGDGGGDGPRDLRATDVGPRSARLSWKPPSNPAGGYRLSYGIEGQEVEEVVLDSSVTDYNLPRLRPGSKYAVQLQAEGGDQSWAPTSTEFTTGSLRFPFPTDCSQELLNGVRTSGEAELFPLGGPGAPVRVYCDMETDGGGWTVFQRRKDGSVNFFRGWKDYVKGFGDLSGEFWLGLDVLHNLTTATKMSLRVDLRDADESAFAKYARFEVGRRNYRLTVGGYSGTAGDSLSYHSNRVFSTKDRDPTPFITRCAMSYRGGWWYKNCHEANLNGLYGIAVKHQGVIWTTWKGKEFSIPFTEMKMRPAAFRPPSRGRERRQ